MKFDGANPSVVRCVKQRGLRDSWLRARRNPRILPMTSAAKSSS